MKKSIKANAGDDIYKLSKQREIYKDGFIIDEIDAGSGSLTLSNSLTLSVGETRGGMNDEVMKFMIRKTVEEHLKREKSHIRVRALKFFRYFYRPG